MIMKKTRVLFSILLILCIGLTGCIRLLNHKIIDEKSEEPSLFIKKVKVNKKSAFLKKNHYEFIDQKNIEIPKDIYQGRYNIAAFHHGKLTLRQDDKILLELELESDGQHPFYTELDIQSGEKMDVEGGLIFTPIRAMKTGSRLYNGSYIAGRDFSSGVFDRSI